MKKPDKRLRPGAMLGKYRLKRRLGEGGFGVVWRAYDSVEGIDVALKVPFPQYTDDKSLEEFRREARLQASLDHPHILKIKTAELIDGHFVIATDLGKRTFSRHLRRAFSLKKAVAHFDQLLDAMTYAHEKRVLHRDLKPENILVFHRDHLRLCDFGIAKLLEKRSVTTTISGTIGYMAPEAAYGKPSKASDVFSLGLLLWQMLAGRAPVWPFAWPFPGYERFRKKAPPALEHFIRKACAFDPRKRFRNAGEMRRAFAALSQNLGGRKRRR